MDSLSWPAVVVNKTVNENQLRATIDISTACNFHYNTPERSIEPKFYHTGIQHSEQQKLFCRNTKEKTSNIKWLWSVFISQQFADYNEVWLSGSFAFISQEFVRTIPSPLPKKPLPICCDWVYRRLGSAGGKLEGQAKEKYLQNTIFSSKFVSENTFLFYRGRKLMLHAHVCP